MWSGRLLFGSNDLQAKGWNFPTGFTAQSYWRNDMPFAVLTARQNVSLGRARDAGTFAIYGWDPFIPAQWVGRMRATPVEYPRR
jgi:hypothetical protein